MLVCYYYIHTNAENPWQTPSSHDGTTGGNELMIQDTNLKLIEGKPDTHEMELHTRYIGHTPFDSHMAEEHHNLLMDPYQS